MNLVMTVDSVFCSSKLVSNDAVFRAKDETPTSTNRAKCKRNTALTHKWNIVNFSYSVSIFSLVNANDKEI